MPGGEEPPPEMPGRQVSSERHAVVCVPDSGLLFFWEEEVQHGEAKQAF